MATYKLIQNGETINTIEASQTFVMAYCESEGLVYELVPEPETPINNVPSEEEDNSAMLVDHEYRLTMLELGMTE